MTRKYPHNIPCFQNVDYDSQEFLEGFEDGKANRPELSKKYANSTQHWFDYVEGYQMGDAERMPDEHI